MNMSRLKALADAEVNIRAIAQGSTERNISIVVDTSDVPEALRALHRAFFNQPADGCIQVFCAGVGQVGREFLGQWMKTKSTFEAELGGEIKLVGLANSTSYVMDANGLEPDANALQDSGRARSASDATEVLRAFHALPGRRKIWVDNSAADAVADAGIEALKLGMGYVCSNKIAATRSLADWNVLRASGARFKNETNVGAALPILHGLRSMLETGDRIKRIGNDDTPGLNIMICLDGGEVRAWTTDEHVRSASPLCLPSHALRLALASRRPPARLLILASAWAHVARTVSQTQSTSTT